MRRFVGNVGMGCIVGSEFSAIFRVGKYIHFPLK